jgi:hypothetical protein
MLLHPLEVARLAPASENGLANCPGFTQRAIWKLLLYKAVDPKATLCSSKILQSFLEISLSTLNGWRHVASQQIRTLEPVTPLPTGEKTNETARRSAPAVQRCAAAVQQKTKQKKTNLCLQKQKKEKAFSCETPTSDIARTRKKES